MFIITLMLTLALCVFSCMCVSETSRYLIPKGDEKQVDPVRFEIFMKYSFLWGVLMLIGILSLVFFGVDWTIITGFFGS